MIDLQTKRYLGLLVQYQFIIYHVPRHFSEPSLAYIIDQLAVAGCSTGARALMKTSAPLDFFVFVCLLLLLLLSFFFFFFDPDL